MIIDFLVINLVRREMAKNNTVPGTKPRRESQHCGCGQFLGRGCGQFSGRGVVSSWVGGVVSSWSCDIVWLYRESWPPPEETCSHTSVLPLALSCTRCMSMTSCLGVGMILFLFFIVM